MRRDIQWYTAEVEDGTLSVWVSGSPDENPHDWELWSAAFQKVLARGTDGYDPAIELISGGISVPAIADADADEIGDQLEQLVRLVNDQYDADRRAKPSEARQSQALRDGELQRRFRRRGAPRTAV